MTKAEFINKMHEHNSNETSKVQTEKALTAFLAAMTEALASGETVTFTGFGSFSVAQRAARQGRNPRTGQPVNIAASKAVKFKPGKSLKEAVK